MGRGNHCKDCTEMTGGCDAAAARQVVGGHQMRRGGGPTVFQTFLVVYLVLIPTVLSLNACRFEDLIQREEKDCLYGRYTDYCGTFRCQKGPGDTCGGRRDIHGVCANGLLCSNCQRCTGCSYQSFICWEDLECM